MSVELQTVDEYTRCDMVVGQTTDRLLEALITAREYRETARSYRNFKVGAAVVAHTDNLPYSGIEPAQFSVYVGANHKPGPNSRINQHAEQVALRAVDRAVRDDLSIQAISMVAVVGETQPDQQSGREMATLHPCGLCRRRMCRNHLIDHEVTLIASALPDLRKIELYSLYALQQYHQTGSSAGITQFSLSKRDVARAEGDYQNNAIEDYLAMRRETMLAGALL